MRTLFIASLAVAASALGGCSGKGVDPTMNQVAPTGTSNYPAGPYGYAQDSTIENLQFIGKSDPSGATGTANYTGLTMQPVQLSDYYGNSSVQYIFLAGVAGWCGPCNNEQPSVRAAQTSYEAKGVKFLEALNEGFDESTGAPATEADLNKWASRHSLHLTLATDPNDRIHQYADEAAFPLNMVIRTSDMKIVFVALGQQDLPTILGQFVP
jgi:hypothetical protein